jgi:hypothetical protein
LKYCMNILIVLQAFNVFMDGMDPFLIRRDGIFRIFELF